MDSNVIASEAKQSNGCHPRGSGDPEFGFPLKACGNDRRPLLRNVSGFSMVEVILALVIISVLASGIFATISFSKRMSIRSQDKAIAVSFVEKKMNELKAGGLPNNGTIEEEVSWGEPTASLSFLDPTSGGTTTIGTLTTQVTDTPPADPKMKEVKVTLQWNDRLGAQRSESAVTVLYQE
ncbi:MAG: type II secretion system protein, partial [Candidatus Omnitrophica bacterium]|nr:type II secretion system protein [Candidatus Omnitrophota bacterium]